MIIDPTVQIAEAIVQYLPTQSYSGLVITAKDIERRYYDIRSILELEGFRVVVAPVEIAHITESKCAIVDTHNVAIFTKNHINNQDVTTVDPMRNLVKEIKDHLQFQRMANMTFIGMEEPTFYDQDLATQNNVFMSEVRMIYRG